MMTTTTSKSQEQVVQQQQQQQLKKIKKERGFGCCCNIYRLFLLLNIISFLQYYYYRNIYNNDSTITVETTTTTTTTAVATVAPTVAIIKNKDKNDSKNKKKKQRRSPLKITRFIDFDGSNSTNNNSNNNRSRNHRNKNNNSSKSKKILLTTDFSDLIDVTILGFPKCGTTSLSSWFQNHPEIYSMSGEPTFMTDSNMSDIHTVQALYNFFYHHPKEQKVYRKQEQARNNENNGTSPTITTDDIRIRAYKNPGDIYKKLAIQNIQNHFPSMKLIVGLRHPVLWFESFYNYWNTIADNGRRQPLPIDPIELIGPCHQQSGIANVCTDHAAFHYYLKRVIGDTSSTGSSTPTNTSSSSSSNSGDGGGNFVLPNTNPIFIYEITQLTDTNKTRMKQFTTDIKNYLGIEKDFKTDEPPKYNTLKKITKTRSRRSRSKHSTSISTNTPEPPLPLPRIINICDYPKVHEVLMKHSIDTANYMKGLLLSNENENEDHSSNSNNNIVTVSSKEYLLSILETKYRQDPCDSRKEEKKKNKRKEKK